MKGSCKHGGGKADVIYLVCVFVCVFVSLSKNQVKFRFGFTNYKLKTSLLLEHTVISNKQYVE